MADAYDGVLEIVRRSKSFEPAWKKVIGICKATQKSAVWNRLPAPDFEGDAEHATTWLKSQMPSTRKACGIYLGLDTLNMESGPCKNLEIGFHVGIRPRDLSMRFLHKLEVRGKDHLIRSLVGMKRVYHKTDVSSFADYFLFLAYSGLVLLAAFERAAISNDYLAVWGFHDGDLFYLIRQVKTEQMRLVHL